MGDREVGQFEKIVIVLMWTSRIASLFSFEAMAKIYTEKLMIGVVLACLEANLVASHELKLLKVTKCNPSEEWLISSRP